MKYYITQPATGWVIVVYKRGKMKYEEFKKICLESLKEKAKKEKFSSDFLERFKKELIQAECYYLDGKDLYEELKTKKSLSRYTIPYVLGFNDSYDLSKKMQLIQIKDGDSGGIDIDSDFETSGRDIIIDYLKQKYGEDCVFPVGTVSMLGLKSAAKDLLKYYEASFKESNEFTSALDDEFSFEENIERFKTNNKSLYSFYLKNKNILDLVPKFLNKIRQYCLPYWAKINTDEGFIEISKLDNKKNKIEYFDKEGRVKKTNNYSLTKTGKQKYYKITLDDGSVIEVTGNHKMFTDSGIKLAKDLTEFDKLVCKATSV